jgi:aminoglycoside phosphotransferase (APT) family kinase protein
MDCCRQPQALNPFSENTAMNIFRNRALFAFALAALAAALHAAPAGAMGHSGARASSAESRAQAAEHPARVETETQVQIDALRKELAEIKAQLAAANSVAIVK